MSDDLSARAAFFRALSHPARLTVLRLTWTQALSGEHLARLLGLSAATVSSHLTQLTGVGLLDVQQDGHQKLYRVRTSALDIQLAALVRGEAAQTLVLAQTPATQTPATQTPATQTPAAQTPAIQTPATQMTVQAADPYRERVLRAFIRQGKLTTIPAQRKKKDVILEYLAELFEPGRQYPEREVNALLGEYHPDFFTLRREMVGLGVL